MVRSRALGGEMSSGHEGGSFKGGRDGPNGELKRVLNKILDLLEQQHEMCSHHMQV